MDTTPLSPAETCQMAAVVLQWAQLYEYYDTRSLPLEAADARKRMRDAMRELLGLG